jgi:hypothetical protein
MTGFSHSRKFVRGEKRVSAVSPHGPPSRLISFACVDVSAASHRLGAR